MSMEQNTRKEGFYLVRHFETWLVAQWKGEYWHIPFEEDCKDDIYFSEINETRIPMPDEPESTLMWAFNDMIKRGHKFTYDPKERKLDIFQHEPARVTGVTVSAGFGFDDKRKIGIEERINDPKNAAAHERWVEIQNRPGLSEYDKKRLPWDFGEYLRIYHPEVKGAPDNRAELEAEWINYLNYCGY